MNGQHWYQYQFCWDMGKWYYLTAIHASLIFRKKDKYHRKVQFLELTIIFTSKFKTHTIKNHEPLNRPHFFGTLKKHVLILEKLRFFYFNRRISPMCFQEALIEPFVIKAPNKSVVAFRKLFNGKLFKYSLHGRLINFANIFCESSKQILCYFYFINL